MKEQAKMTHELEVCIVLFSPSQSKRESKESRCKDDSCNVEVRGPPVVHSLPLDYIIVVVLVAQVLDKVRKDLRPHHSDAHCD